MSEPDDKDPSGDDYEKVGYGRPPRRTRFKPGQSGNPKGRPKGGRGLGAVLNSALGGRVAITENGRQRSIRREDFLGKQIFNLAAKGNFRAIEQLVKLMQFHEAKNCATGPAAREQFAEFAAGARASLARKFSALIDDDNERAEAEKEKNEAATRNEKKD